jgi:hypothetical protein
MNLHINKKAVLLIFSLLIFAVLMAGCTAPILKTTNHALIITSTPITSAVANQTYTYKVNTTDPDAGDTLTYALSTKPSGMTINPVTGLISWTPISGQIGDNDVIAEVSVGDKCDTQNFTIAVSETPPAPAVPAPPAPAVPAPPAPAVPPASPTPPVPPAPVAPPAPPIPAPPVPPVPTVPPAPPVPLTLSNLSLTPFLLPAVQGSQVTIYLKVEDAADLKGASITLNYNASKLQYSSSAAGSFIPNANLFASGTSGSVTLDLAGLGATSYASSTGTIITVVFNTIGTGNTNITFGTTTLRDKDNADINHTRGNGCSVNIN